MPDDETQHSPDASPPGRLPFPGAWLRWIGGGGRDTKPETASVPARAAHGVHAALRAVPTLLDGSSLPNGVVELLIEDFEAPARQLFDINDGHITILEPGGCVPWTSIAGSPTAWALALGPQRDTDGLRLTGDQPLARRVLDALPAGDSAFPAGGDLAPPASDSAL